MSEHQDAVADLTHTPPPGGSQLIVLQEARAFAGSIDQAPCNGCDECGARCTAGVPIARLEYQEIRAYLATEEGAEARRVEQQDKQVPYPGAEEYYYMACRFRDVERGRCSIYPVRPVVCRLFGHVEWLPCPIEKISGPVSGGVEAMRRYGSVPQKTYEDWLAEEG